MKTETRCVIFRLARICVVVALLFGVGRWVHSTLRSRESEQAIINAELVQIRTPIGGQLEFTGLRPGAYVKKGTPLLRINNSRFGDRASSALSSAEETQVAALESEALGARYTIEVEGKTRAQYRMLYKSGSVARQEMEKSETRYDMAVELAKVKQEQLERARIRAREMAAQTALQKECVIEMPSDGVVWAINAKPGEQVDANDLVMEIINPQHVWVDAFFSERHASELRPGLPVSIQSLDGSGMWNGVLQSVRGGVGRMAVDSTVAVPPPESVKRQVAVRIEAQWDGSFDPIEFCRVGRSVQVTYSRSAEPSPNPAAITATASALNR